MSALQTVLQDYLSLRHGLGFKLREADIYLPNFVSFLEQRQAQFITTDLALTWAQQPRSALPSCWARRLCLVRGFARYCAGSGFDQRTEIPPPELLPFRGNRAKPYFYSDDDIERLLQAAFAQPKYPLQGWTYYVLLGLLAVTGLRLGEALALTVDDVDLIEGVLTIRNAKFGKSRLVPLHVSTQRVLSEYLEQRQRFLAGRPAQHLFVSLRGNHLDPSQVERVFRRLTRQVGLRAQGASRGPRMLDFRHRFAVVTLIQWYRAGQDVERRLPVLSTYLGHVDPSSTYWYLSATTDLMDIAKTRLEHYWRQTS
ncbi:MAG TPA: tyrosine-type recombinase/integrase [Rhizobacter sp.]|nr:tyrosine-type recombinase/integrase [Rhizobacter sp.]